MNVDITDLAVHYGFCTAAPDTAERIHFMNTATKRRDAPSQSQKDGWGQTMDIGRLGPGCVMVCLMLLPVGEEVLPVIRAMWQGSCSASPGSMLLWSWFGFGGQESMGSLARLQLDKVQPSHSAPGNPCTVDFDGFLYCTA